jgi:hypothetical protein
MDSLPRSRLNNKYPEAGIGRLLLKTQIYSCYYILFHATPTSFQKPGVLFYNLDSFIYSFKFAASIYYGTI